jgi:hypothetical protein
MAKGDLSYKVSDISINRMGAQIEVRANATKLLEDEDGTVQFLGSWTGTLKYPSAGFGAKTMTQLSNELIAEIKAKNAAIAAKTIA